MDINVAKSAFKNILYSLNMHDRLQFLSWCEENYAGINYSKTYFDLRVIAEDIKSMVPTEAILHSENVDHFKIQNNSSGCKPVLHIDSFLFEEEHIDGLEAEGKIKRNYCEKCGSMDIAPISFISHSASIKRIEFIFKNMLPDLTDKVFLDVGSRLGAILYGAYYCSSAQKIIGVEMDEDFCKLQKCIVDKYGLNDRIEIICNNICNIPEVLQSANVIVFNNVFQCFMPQEMQQKVWVWLRKTLTIPGTIILTIPSMEETLSNLQTEIDVPSWLQQIPIPNNNMEDEDNMDDPDLLFKPYCYTVL